MASKEVVLKEARSHIGLGEPNFIQKWYSARNGNSFNYNFAWCAAFVTYCLVKSGGAGIPDFAYTPWFAEWFQKNSRFTFGTKGMREGDVVFFNWSGKHTIGNIDHVGIVEKKVSAGLWHTIEGNIGNQCKRVSRDSKYIVGYGRPAYTDTKPTTQPNTGNLPHKKLVPFDFCAWPYTKVTEIKAGTKNSRGVATVQYHLNRLNYTPKLEVDGDWGELTTEANRKFRKAIGYSPYDGCGKYAYHKLWSLKEVDWSKGN